MFQTFKVKIKDTLRNFRANHHIVTTNKNKNLGNCMHIWSFSSLISNVCAINADGAVVILVAVYEDGHAKKT